jgi:hypothetical protein
VQIRRSALTANTGRAGTAIARVCGLALLTALALSSPASAAGSYTLPGSGYVSVAAGYGYACGVRQRVRASGVLLAVLAAAVLLSVAPSRAAAQTQDPTCSRQTAEQIAGPTNPFNSNVSDPVLQVLCGPLAGPGSNAMAVSLTASTCWSPQGWSIYIFTGSVWQQALHVPDWLSERLVVLDGGIREVSPVFTRYDPRCVPSGGTRGRTWKWNGSQFTASAWKHTPLQIVLAPTAVCQLQDDGTPSGSFAYCWVGNERRHARLAADGTVNSTHRQVHATGLGGPGTPVGHVDTAGRFRCQTHRSNVTCWVRSSGKGMRFNVKGEAKRVIVK